MHMSQLTWRECELAALRANRGWLTTEERQELDMIHRVQQLREEEAAKAAELHSEGRTFKDSHPNPHGD